MDNMSFITSFFFKFIEDIVKILLSSMGFMIADLYEYVLQVNQSILISSATFYSSLLGPALCSLMVGKQMIGTYGFGNRGDSDQDSMEVVFRLCLVLGVIGMNSWLFNEAVQFSKAIAYDISAAVGSQINSQAVYDSLDAMSLITSPMTIMFSSVIMIGYIFFGITAALRGAECTLSKILLPIFAVDLLNPNSERWNMFIFQYIVSFGAYIVQLLCYQVFAFYLVNINAIGGFGFKNFVLLLGWLVLSIRSPKWLEKYIYATGTGQAISRGAGRVGQVLMYVGMRR